MIQTCVVTGGAGLIGSHLIDKLLNSNYRVVCVDNLISGSRENINHNLNSDRFIFYEEDLTKDLSQKLSAEIKSAHSIFHLASPASPNSKSKIGYPALPLETLLVNSLGTYKLLELMNKKEGKFLFASTSEVYGDPEVHPQKEDYWGNVNPTGERSCYDEAKRFGEALTFTYIRKYSINARVIRIFNTYGPRMQKDDGRAVSEFINHALTNKQIPVFGNGSQTRSFCFVEDMVEGIIKAMYVKSSKGQVFNLGNPQEITILDLAKQIINLTQSHSTITNMPLPHDDPKKRKPDITKATTYLGWEPKTELKEGLLKTIAYFK